MLVVIMLPTPLQILPALVMELTACLAAETQCLLFNLAWNYDNKFFWDGRDSGLENQAFEPVTNPIEMHTTWDAVT